MTSDAMHSDVIFDAIDAIYETTAEEQHWPNALERIAACLDAKGAVLITQRQDQSIATVVSTGIMDAQAAYDSHWWKHDFLTERAIEYGLVSGKDVFRDTDMSIEEERLTHPFYLEFRKPFGLGGALAGSVAPTPETIVALSVQGHYGAPAFSDEHNSIMRRLIKHCERALVLSCQAWEQRLVNLALEQMLSRLGCGVMMLDDAGRLIHVNATGEALLRTDIRLAGGRLTLHAQEARRALDEAIVSALSDTPDDRLTCPRPIISPRGEDKRPLILYVLPLRSEAAAHVWSPLQRVGALVIIVDPATSTDLDPALVRDYLGLTLGEARVAAKVGLGLSPRQTAKMLGISEETARTTLKRIFSKTGVTRQSELAVLLSRLDQTSPDRAHDGRPIRPD